MADYIIIALIGSLIGAGIGAIIHYVRQKKDGK